MARLRLGEMAWLAIALALLTFMTVTRPWDHEPVAEARPAALLETAAIPAVLSPDAAPMVDPPASIEWGIAPSIAKVGHAVTIVATVLRANGERAVDEPIEWVLAGGSVGRIGECSGSAGGGPREEAARSPFFSAGRSAGVAPGSDAPPPLLDDPGVLAATASPSALEPGQAACVLHSDVAGSAYLTVRAPRIADRTKQERTLRVHWRRARLQFTRSLQATLGGSARLVARVVDDSNGEPLSGYRVRYQVDPRGATVFDGGVWETDAVSDAGGFAVARVQHRAPTAPATSEVVVRLLGTEAVVGEPPVVLEDVKTTIEWSALPVRLIGEAPEASAIGEWAKIRVQVETEDARLPEGLVLVAVLPEGLETDPPVVDRELPLLEVSSPGGGSAEFAVRSRTPRKAAIRLDLRTDKKTWLTRSAEVAFLVPSLELVKELPREWKLGEKGTYRITVRNSGPVDARDVVVRDLLPSESGLAVEATDGVRQSEEIRWPFDVLPRGAQKTLTVSATPRRAVEGLVLAAVAESPVGILGRTEAALVVGGLPALELILRDLADPVEAGEPLGFEIELANRGLSTAHWVKLEVETSGDVRFADARGDLPSKTAGGRLILGPIESVAPGETKTCYATAASSRPGEARLSVRVVHDSVGPTGLVKDESTIVSRRP